MRTPLTYGKFPVNVGGFGCGWTWAREGYFGWTLSPWDYGTKYHPDSTSSRAVHETSDAALGAAWDYANAIERGEHPREVVRLNPISQQAAA